MPELMYPYDIYGTYGVMESDARGKRNWAVSKDDAYECDAQKEHVDMNAGLTSHVPTRRVSGGPGSHESH